MNELKTTVEARRRRPLAALGLVAAVALGLLAPQPSRANTAFTFLGALASVITPNGDGLNDVALLCFDNPRASDVSGTIFDLRGNKVTTMAFVAAGVNCPGATVFSGKLTWDGRQAGRTVASGVYFYQIRSEDTTITGALMVVR